MSPRTTSYFWPFWITEFIFSHLQIEFRLIRCWAGGGGWGGEEGMVGVAHIVAGHGQAQ